MESSSRLRPFARSRFEALDIEGADRAKAGKLRAALEREIASRVAKGGKKALTTLVTELNALGHSLQRVKSDPGWTSFHQTTNDGTRTFHLHVFLEPDEQTVMVLYNETLETTVARRKARMTAVERIRAEIEEEFARRGLALNTSRKPYASLGPADRLIASLHELEGGVNNGGFHTYLLNTGGRRMADAHRFLVRIGATRTARVVGEVRALFPRGFGASFERTSLTKLDQQRETLDRLTNRFYRSSENLSLLAMRHVGEPKRRSRKR